MKRSFMCVVLAISMVAMSFPTSVFAGGSGIIIKFIYEDAEVLRGDFKDSSLEGFEPTAINGAFVLSHSGGTVSVNEYKPTWKTSNGFKVNNCYWQTSVYAEDLSLVPGTYTLIECPVPDGYEIVEIKSSGKVTITQEMLDDPNVFEVFHFYISLKTAGADATIQEPALPTSQTLTAKPTSSTVLVNGQAVSFDAYNINGNNYFKLRDLAFAISGSEKQFEVGWDGANNAISLSSGKPYTTVGGEMTGKGVGDKTPTPTTSKIYLDGKEVLFTAYNIEGNNYFKLRDIGQAFDFGVDWDGANNTIVIDTSNGYAPE